MGHFNNESQFLFKVPSNSPKLRTRWLTNTIRTDHEGSNC